MGKVNGRSDVGGIQNNHHNDVIMDAIASKITSLTIVYSTDYSDADHGKHQTSASLAFVWETHRGPVNSPHKGPVTRRMFPFDDVIMLTHLPSDDTFKYIFLNENVLISIKFHCSLFPNGTIINLPALIRKMAWRPPGDKPLSEPVLDRFTDAYMPHKGELN